MYKQSRFSPIFWLLFLLLSGCANHKICRRDVANKKYSPDIFFSRGVNYIRKTSRSWQRKNLPRPFKPTPIISMPTFTGAR